MLQTLRCAGEPQPTITYRPSRYPIDLARQATTMLAVIWNALMAHRTYELLRSRGVPHGEALERVLGNRPRSVPGARAVNDETSARPSIATFHCCKAMGD